MREKCGFSCILDEEEEKIPSEALNPNIKQMNPKCDPRAQRQWAKEILGHQFSTNWYTGLHLQLMIHHSLSVGFKNE